MDPYFTDFVTLDSPLRIYVNNSGFSWSAWLPWTRPTHDDDDSSSTSTSSDFQDRCGHATDDPPDRDGSRSPPYVERPYVLLRDDEMCYDLPDPNPQCPRLITERNPVNGLPLVPRHPGDPTQGRLDCTWLGRMDICDLECCYVAINNRHPAGTERTRERARARCERLAFQARSREYAARTRVGFITSRWDDLGASRRRPI